MQTEINISNIYKSVIESIEKELQYAIDNVKEDLSSPWDECDSVIGMRPSDDGPYISLYLQTENTSDVAHFKCSIDEFLDEIRDFYSYGEDGWGEEMIDDLEILKGKIQERIDQMRKEIEEDQ
jgi:hypothetical protein